MSSLNLIIGEDKELVNFYLEDILSKIEYNEDKKIEYDMSISSISDIIDEASMISLFSDEKIIIGNNFNISDMNSNDVDYLSRYIKNINNNVWIILIAKKIDARVKEYKIFKDNFKIIDVNSSNNKSNLYEYVSSYIKDKGYKIDRYVLEYLLNRLGNDINNIILELDKIFIYRDDNKVIDRETVDLLIEENIDNVIYEWTNAILDKDYDKVSKMYDNFKLENIGFDYLIASLGNSFRQALVIKIMNNNGESNFSISKFIGKKEFYVKKMIDRLYQYTEDDLINYIKELAKIDREFKMGKSNIDMLEFFLLKM